MYRQWILRQEVLSGRIQGSRVSLYETETCLNKFSYIYPIILHIYIYIYIWREPVGCFWVSPVIFVQAENCCMSCYWGKIFSQESPWVSTICKWRRPIGQGKRVSNYGELHLIWWAYTRYRTQLKYSLRITLTWD